MATKRKKTFRLTGKKTYLGVIVLAVLTCLGDAHLVSAEHLSVYRDAAQFLIAGGLLHKAERWIEAWLKRTK